MPRRRGAEAQIAASEAYMPVVARAREDDAIPLRQRAAGCRRCAVARLVARLTSALRLRTLHATVIGRARTLKSERNIIAELPPGDPLEDATVLVVGRGRMHPTLSVAVGERMGVIGAMSVELAARCLNAREIDGIVIGDGLSPKLVVALLVVLGRGCALPRAAGRHARPRRARRRTAQPDARPRSAPAAGAR